MFYDVFEMESHVLNESVSEPVTDVFVVTAVLDVVDDAVVVVDDAVVVVDDAVVAIDDGVVVVVARS